MGNRMKSGAVAVMAVAIGLVGSQLVACGGAPADSASEAPGTQDEALRSCIGCNPPPQKYAPVCSWNPLTTYTARCNSPWNETTMTKRCVSSAATDPLSVAQRALMTMGCSSPVYWEAHNPQNPNADYGNAWAHLCPIDREIMDYTISIGMLPGADHASHWSTTFCDAQMPPPPQGYFWVIPWMDPMCMMGGCMVNAW